MGLSEAGAPQLSLQVILVLEMIKLWLSSGGSSGILGAVISETNQIISKTIKDENINFFGKDGK